MSAIAAVTQLCGTSKAKSLNTATPLLGGVARGSADHGHASGAGVEETVLAVAQYQKAGYKAIRAQSGIPGLESTYGVGKGPGHYEPAEKNAPPESQWSSEAYMNFIPALFDRLRKEFGPELHLLRASPPDASEAGQWGSRWSHITCSGWRTRRRRNCKKVFA